MTSRRTFLKGLLTVAAAAVIPAKALDLYPILHGDGVHDDTAALQALFNGEKIIVDGHVVDSSVARVFLRIRRFLVSSTIKITPESPAMLCVNECVFLASKDFPPEKSVMHFTHGFSQDGLGQLTNLSVYQHAAR